MLLYVLANFVDDVPTYSSITRWVCVHQGWVENLDQDRQVCSGARGVQRASQSSERGSEEKKKVNPYISRYTIEV